VRRNLKLGAVATVVAVIALTAFATMPASADPGGNGKGKGSDNASENSKVATDEVTTTESSDHSEGNAGTSGDPSEPQPRSNADNNGGGANHEGPYDSTRDGSPSGNGNGGGEATGKPCAGCVGKADNKNPKGQYPNGSDHNNGYECDGNNGIAKTNPAHTGCTDDPPPLCVDDPNTPADECGEEEPPCVDDPNTPDDECDPEEPPCVDDMDTPEDECDPDEVLGGRIDRPRDPDDVLPEFERRPGVKAAVLPFTGGDAAAMGLTALALIASGAVLMASTRRRQRTQ
jgi:hypothetical protein